MTSVSHAKHRQIREICEIRVRKKRQCEIRVNKKYSCYSCDSCSKKLRSVVYIG